MRKSQIARKTNETDIKLELNLDGAGKAELNTGVGFFDHMIDQLARHGDMDISLQAKGDLHIDSHHTVEDVGIVLGQAFKEALGDKSGITRYGECSAPMDEALARCAIDISGRGFCAFRGEFSKEKIGDFDVELIEEFLKAFANNAAITLHVELFYGQNAHHEAEAIFKSLATALKRAVKIDEARKNKVPSTKGSL